jgi:AcrR family transcriptional regulator
MRASGLKLVQGGVADDRAPGDRRSPSAGAPTGGGGARSRASLRVGIVDGAVECIAAAGVSGTTVDEIARRAGCSRATVYRTFPGGRDAIVAAVADTETARLFSELGVVMGEADRLEDVLVAGLVTSATRIAGHAALARLMQDEPELVLPRLTFERMDDVLATASSFVAPFLRRWLPGDDAERVAEWSVRILASYVLSPAEHVDLTDPARTRELVRTFVLPGVAVMRGATEPIDGIVGKSADELGRQNAPVLMHEAAPMHEPAPPRRRSGSTNQKTTPKNLGRGAHP